MDNQIKKTLNQGILGTKSENPYFDLVNGNQNQQQPEIPQGTHLQGIAIQPQQSTDHQAAFEEQLRQSKNQPQQPQQQQQDYQQQQQDGTFAFEHNGTYCRTGTLENGFIETDLQSYKEKGTETRFVSFSVLSLLDEKQIEEIKARNGVANLTMIMTSEEQFNSFKKFIASLNWND
jgi:hypothetical protein